MNHEDNQKDEYTELMHKAQDGDHTAYAKLLRSISPLIRGFIYNRIGNGIDHDDILQEVLLGIHRASHTYNTDRPFKNWMFAIADHKVKDYLRKYYRKKILTQVSFDKVEDFLADNVTNDTSASEQLDELLDDLPDKQRRIVHMMKIEGYTAKEVANTMDMSVSAVKVTAHRAYKMLISNGKNKEKL